METVLATCIIPSFCKDDNEDLQSTCEWGVKHILVKNLARELLQISKYSLFDAVL